MFKRQAERNPFFGNTDWDKGMSFVWGHIDGGNAWIADGYLIIATVAKPWYNNDQLLVEQLVLKINRTGVISSVPIALEQLAKEFGCNKIVVSDSSLYGTYRQACEDAGFLPFSPTLYKVLPCAEL